MGLFLRNKNGSITSQEASVFLHKLDAPINKFTIFFTVLFHTLDALWLYCYRSAGLPGMKT
jgi:hypothetical protein